MPLRVTANLPRPSTEPLVLRHLSRQGCAKPRVIATFIATRVVFSGLLWASSRDVKSASSRRFSWDLLVVAPTAFAPVFGHGRVFAKLFNRLRLV